MMHICVGNLTIIASDNGLLPGRRQAMNIQKFVMASSNHPCFFFRKHHKSGDYQSGRSPKVVAFFSATNFSSYIIELFQLHDTIQI